MSRNALWFRKDARKKKNSEMVCLFALDLFIAVVFVFIFFILQEKLPFQEASVCRKRLSKELQNWKLINSVIVFENLQWMKQHSDDENTSCSNYAINGDGNLSSIGAFDDGGNYRDANGNQKKRTTMGVEGDYGRHNHKSDKRNVYLVLMMVIIIIMILKIIEEKLIIK